jgi:uncharacterized protein (DUF849 family)
VPTSASELACDAVAVRTAGAEELHILVRAEDGAETLEPSAVAKTIQVVRHGAPGMPIGVGTGAWIMPGGRRRHRHIRNWTEKPDYASVNLGEADAPEVIDLLVAGGVGVEAGLWNGQDAERFVAEIDFEKCLRVLVEMTSSNGEGALRELIRSSRYLIEQTALCLSSCMEKPAAFGPAFREAWRLNLSTRIGFEDGVHLPNSIVAADNADLVR